MLGALQKYIRICENIDVPPGIFDLYSTCMAFLSGNKNDFMMGSESGIIYTD